MPPIIQPDRNSQSSPPGSVIWLNGEDPTPREWEFAVVVIEEDVDRPLEARFRIKKHDEELPAYTTLAPLAPGKRLRPVNFKITSAQLSFNECHYLQLAVSGSFLKGSRNMDPRLFDYTDPDDDLALASWVIWEGQGNAQILPDNAVSIVKTCGATENVSSSSATAQAVP